MTQKTKTSVLQLAPFVLGLILTGFITACGSGDGGPKGGAIDACALLEDVHPETLLGGPVDEGKKIVDRHDAEATISMCGYSARGPGLKSVSLHVMYAGNHNNPKTAAEYLEGKDFGSVGMKKPTEVHGLGDVALSTSMPGGILLQVFWKKHYQMKVSLSGMSDPAQALEKAKQVARHVMERL